MDPSSDQSTPSDWKKMVKTYSYYANQYILIKKAVNPIELIPKISNNPCFLTISCQREKLGCQHCKSTILELIFTEDLILPICMNRSHWIQPSMSTAF